MEILVYRRGIPKIQEDFTADDLPELLKDQSAVIWVDMESLGAFYRDVYDHLVRVVDLAENYRDLISGSLETYLSVVSNRLNEIMKVLTLFQTPRLDWRLERATDT